ncbi:MAG: hypothetical protein M3Z92_04605 [Bacteroidota bacterium]|nr:hypothetical protein [Bacteroidota bacterium]
MKLACRSFIPLIFMFMSVSTIAQIDYPVFKNRIEINPADSQKLSLNIYNLNYIYNTEYFTKIPLSGTLFGYQLIPEIQYQPNSRFVIKGGVYLQKEFGRNGYTSLLPTFSVKYKAKQSSYILGTLEGNTNHGYVEPIYDYKLLINERLENGFQFFVNTKSYEHDFFINWRRAIHLGDPFKEQFDIGYLSKFNILSNDKVEIKIPLQLLYTHKGGQIDSSSIPLTSIVDDALGVSIAFNLGNQFLKKIILDNYYVNYKDISGTKVQPFNEGNAYLAHLLLKFKYFDLDTRYWNSEGFINPRGNSLFSSVSEKYPGLTERHRQLLLVSLIYDKQLFRNGNFDFRFSPYYDFVEKKLEYSYEMYFSYQLNVLLAKIKNSFMN